MVVTKTVAAAVGVERIHNDRSCESARLSRQYQMTR